MADANLAAGVTITFKSVNGQMVIDTVNGISQKVDALKGKSNMMINVFRQFLPVLAVAEIIKFLKDSVAATEEEAEALRILKGELEAQGKPWADVEQQIRGFATSLQMTSRFSDTMVYKSMGSLAGKLGDVNEALGVTQLAANIAASKGLKEFGSTAEDLAYAMIRPERGAYRLKAEFGELLKGTKNVNEMLKRLQEHFAGAAAREEGLTATTAKLKNAFGEFQEEVGTGITPVWITILKGADIVVKAFRTLSNSLSKVVAFFAPGTWKEKMAAINKLTREGADIWVNSEIKKGIYSLKTLKVHAEVNAETLRKEKELADARKKLLEDFSKEYEKFKNCSKIARR